MPKFITPVDLAPTIDGTFVNVDVTAHVGADAGSLAGVILIISSLPADGGTEYKVAVRRNGSTDDFFEVLEDQSWSNFYVGVDSNDQFEIKIDSGSPHKVHLVGYITTAEGHFFDNATEISPASAAAWLDLDFSGFGDGSDIVKCAFGIMESAGAPAGNADVGLRVNGSTDDTNARHNLLDLNIRGLAMVCDVNEKIEGYTEDLNYDLHWMGYLTANITVIGPPMKDYIAAGAGAYEDVDFSTDIPAGNTGACTLYEGGEFQGWIFENEATLDRFGDVSSINFMLHEITSARKARQKIETTHPDLWLWGYTNDPAGGSLLPRPRGMRHMLVR